MAHLVDRHVVERANTALMLGFLWAGLAAFTLKTWRVMSLPQNSLRSQTLVPVSRRPSAENTVFRNGIRATVIC